MFGTLTAMAITAAAVVYLVKNIVPVSQCVVDSVKEGIQEGLEKVKVTNSREQKKRALDVLCELTEAEKAEVAESLGYKKEA